VKLSAWKIGWTGFGAWHSGWVDFGVWKFGGDVWACWWAVKEWIHLRLRVSSWLFGDRFGFGFGGDFRLTSFNYT